MRIVLAVMLALLAAACRDDRAATTSTTGAAVSREPLATDQENDAPDLALGAEIRRKLVGDGDLSARAKNAVVVVRDGVVTVRGDVASRADHDRLVAHVVSVPGVVRVDDRIHVEGP